MQSWELSVLLLRQYLITIGDKMTEDQLKLLKTLLPVKDSGRAITIESVYDAVKNKVYLQSEPFIDGDKVVIKRIAEVDVTIEKAMQIVEEYEMTAKDESDLMEECFAADGSD